MNERWVCKRCFADNNDTDTSCVKCGLARGAEATDADQAGWAASQPQAEAPAWRGLLRFWWIPVVVVALAVGYFTTARRGDDGALTTGGTVTVDELQVGDCFNSGDELEISDVDGVPCDEPHAYEAYLVEDYDAGTFPDDSEWETVFLTRCVSEFEPYVGAPYDTSAIYATMMTPTADGWAAGDHEFICYLYEPKANSPSEPTELTSSLRGAAR